VKPKAKKKKKIEKNTEKGKNFRRRSGQSRREGLEGDNKRP